MTLGEIIKKYRMDNDQTIDEFSKKCGLSKSYISMLETNKSHHRKSITPSTDTIYRIAMATNNSFDDIYRKLDNRPNYNIHKPSMKHVGFLPLEYAQMYAVLDDQEKDKIHQEIIEKYNELQEYLKEYDRVAKMSEITTIQDARIFMKHTGIYDENANERDIIHDANTILKYNQHKKETVLA